MTRGRCGSKVGGMKRALALVALLLLAGCGGAVSPAATATKAATSTATRTPAATAANVCLPVEQALAVKILDGVPNGTAAERGFSVVKVAAVKSESGDYFVGVRFTHPEGEDVGVWQTRALDGSAPIGSVDAYAKSYTQWPDTGNAGSKVASQASACVK